MNSTKKIVGDGISALSEHQQKRKECLSGVNETCDACGAVYPVTEHHQHVCLAKILGHEPVVRLPGFYSGNFNGHVSIEQVGQQFQRHNGGD